MRSSLGERGWDGIPPSLGWGHGLRVWEDSCGDLFLAIAVVQRLSGSVNPAEVDWGLEPGVSLRPHGRLPAADAPAYFLALEGLG